MKHNIDETIFEKIDTEIKAYLLGWAYSDGHVSSRLDKFCISLKESDVEILDLFAKTFKYTGKYYKSKKTNKDGSFRYTLALPICRKKVVNDLIKLGCIPRKTFTLKFPSFDIVPENLFHHFVRGFFDGDGCIWIKDDYYASFSVIGCHHFISNLFKYLSEKLELRLPILAKRKTKTPNEFIYTSEFVNKVGPHCYAKKIYEYLYKDSNFHLTRKRLIFDNVIELCNKATEERYTCQKDSFGADNYVRSENVNKEIYNKISIKNQGRGKRGKLNYIGLCERDGLIGVFIMKNRRSYCRGFKDIKIAAKMYDKMALYLYGENAVLNFPDAKYTKDELEKTYKYFTYKRKASSTYKNISFDKKKKYWRAIVVKNKETMVKISCDEVEAAEYSDIIKYIYFEDKDITKLNFPNKVKMYEKVSKEDLNSYYPLRNFYKNA